MKIISILIIFIFYNTSINSKNLFETDSFEINFFSNDVENLKIKSITEIKFKTFNIIFENILIEEDYSNLQKIIDEDLINTFIKNIIINDEKIIENNYSAKIKINYEKNLIINYLRKHKLPYLEYLPQQFLTIIYENKKISKNLFSIKNNYYEFLLKNNNNFFYIPKLDVNDRYLLNEKDLQDKSVKKINKFIEKYNKSEAVIIFISEIDSKISYETYLYAYDNFIEVNKFYEDTKAISSESLFKSLKKDIINKWKVENKIQNLNLNKITCNITFFNLYELKQIKTNLSDISIIKNFKSKNISFKNNVYDIFFYGNIEILPKLFNLSGLNLNLTDNMCKVNLR